MNTLFFSMYWILFLLGFLTWVKYLLKNTRLSVIIALTLIYIAQPALPWSVFEISQVNSSVRSLLVAYAFYYFIFNPYKIARQVKSVNYVFLSAVFVLFLLLILFSLISPYQEYGFSKSRAFFFSLIPAASLLLLAPYTKTDIKTICITMFFGALALALVTYIFPERLDSFDRSSVGYDPIVTGQRIGMGFVSSITYLFFIEKKPRHLYILKICLTLIVSAFLGISIVATGSRGPLLATAITFFVFLIFNLRVQIFSRLNFLTRSILVSAIVAPFLVFSPLESDYGSFGGQVQAGYNRILLSLEDNKDSSTSTDERIYNYQISFSGILSSGFFGIGTGGFSELKGVSYPDYPHNLVIEILLELGILGFIVLIFILYYPAKFAFSFINSSDSGLTTIGLLFIYTFVNTNFSSDVSGHPALWVLAVFLLTTNLAYKTDNTMLQKPFNKISNRKSVFGVNLYK